MSLIINQRVYSIGPEPMPGDDYRYLGHEGRRFEIQFHDGRQITTRNLWWLWEARADGPDNAKFIYHENDCVCEVCRVN